ncbi:hypothetical protein FPZ49_11285 [Paenibacillus cremeus]|uniref:Uncharacterized protein n=1 Tax=Paenibacillus cremeus TaxID=2163881 RepID=A0A559KCU4_9BACL|nr:hypothetical protein FPZ49_11285 [Paenibacillus cremeus]
MMISSKSFVVGENAVTSETENFFEALKEEVMQNPKQAKSLLKNLCTTGTTLASMLMQTNLAMAAPTSPVPTDITDGLKATIITIIVIGVGLSIILLSLSSILKMSPIKNKADEWSVNILKGLAQLLMAPIIVGLIVGLYFLLFGNVAIFQPIEDPIRVFFQHH